jgi:hypothetical protein
MQRSKLLGSLTIVLVCVAVVGWTAAGEKEDGFVPLFNGKDLDGWVVMGKPEGWQVKDGILRSEGAAGGDWIRTKKQYGDFTLKLDWRVSKGGNSGVFLRVADKGAPWQTGYEVQISNDPRDEKHCTGALYGYAAVKQRPDESADKWHTFAIHCVGTKIKVVADGLTVIDVDQDRLPAPTEQGYTDPRTKPRRGHLGLQDSHSPKGHYIEYRNVMIKEVNR